MKLIDLFIRRDEPNGDTIFFLGVTSGTTGSPKIVMLSHLNILCGMTSDEFLGFNFSKNDVYLSYVPLTHVYEQIDHCCAISNGFRIGYSSGNP